MPGGEKITIVGIDGKKKERKKTEEEEETHRKELEKEMKGVSYSKSLENEEIGRGDSDSDSDSDSYPGEEGESEDSDPDESSSDEDYDDETSEKKEVRSKITPEMAMRKKTGLSMTSKSSRKTGSDHLKSALLPRKEESCIKQCKLASRKRKEQESYENARQS